MWVTLTQIFNQGRSSILTALHRPTGAVLTEKHFDDNMYNWTGGAAFGGGKVVVDQGGSAGEAEPRRLRVFGVAGVRPTVETGVLEMGRVGKPYSQQLEAADGVGALQWSVTGGALPAGVTMSASGKLSGTPTVAGQSQVTIRATDSSVGRSHEVSFPLLVVPATSPTTWSMGGRTETRNPFSPGTGALDIKKAGQFGFRWQTASGSGAPYYPPNVVTNTTGSRFYTIAGDGELKAYSVSGTTANRTPLWSKPAPGDGNAFAGQVTLADGKLLVRANQGGWLWAFNASNGNVLWHVEVATSPYWAPLVVGDTVVATVESEPGSPLRAYALADGSPRWTGTLTTRGGFGELSTDGTRIFGMSDCVLYALDATNGDRALGRGDPERLPTAVRRPSTAQAAPIVTGGRVYASDACSKVVATASTGAVIDRFRAFNYNGGGGVVVGGVWVYTDDLTVVARDTTTGRRAWSVPVPSAVGGGASVSATGDLLIVSGTYGIAGLDRVTGEQVWDGGSITGYSGSREGIAVAGNRILVPTLDGVRAYGPL